jgi:hypothetical protein
MILLILDIFNKLDNLLYYNIMLTLLILVFYCLEGPKLRLIVFEFCLNS